MKTLKFRPELIELMRKGEKTVTWRLFDDKDLREGDAVQLVNWESGESAGTARLSSVRTLTLSDAWQHDPAGHETYPDAATMLATYRSYYGDRVALTTEVKVIRLVDIRLTNIMHS